MSAHVLLNLLKSLGKVIKCEACRAVNCFFATSLLNSIIQEHECLMILILLFKSHFCVKTLRFCHIYASS